MARVGKTGSMVPWVLLIVAALIAVLVAFGLEGGSCFGMDVDGSLRCASSGPVIGWPGAWAIAVAAFAASAYAMWRIMRLSVRRGERRGR